MSSYLHHNGNTYHDNTANHGRRNTHTVTCANYWRCFSSLFSFPGRLKPQALYFNGWRLRDGKWHCRKCAQQKGQVK